ncbi:iron-sulfur cluster repair di-iron protein [Virgibacillus sp. W0181]|uniref:iron-sulfur cluster repair di-iron protein n=1 Tax=Virgibacillus sp. W0181 TaxID=3391581 RepID=UPI003F47A632
MATFTADQTPASIVKTFPKASDLFKERRIDFCCGGDRPLKEVFREGDYDSETVLSDLNTAFQKWQKEDQEVTDWDAMPSSELIDHIVGEHHAYLKSELSPLGEFVTKIFRVHGKNHPHLKELHRIYNEFKIDMEEHMVTEENDVFPLIKEYEQNPSEALKQEIIDANGGLEDEHEAAGNLLKRMRVITNDFQPPAGACNSYRITYARLADLETDTFQHVHLENNVLFKQL